ncbi:MAG TPA: D-alanyl-D-alanine carboxypeptidase/D-alanyl-D-alanine-endopeptidase [Fimbriimonadaceae bacterium]|nr:D-alanyl-D-alanine carboxypeptidase/D-alanyl-D-alanine-endopeptidase [Fimbriimonadaceae bacterium]
MVATLACALALTSASPIDRVLQDDALKGAIAGICVTTLDGTVVYQHEADTRLVPASNEKILTALYAAHTLGMDFKPQTRFWREDDRVLVDAPGDPTITKQQLLDAKQALNVPEGFAIYVRQAYKPGVPPSWEWDDLPNRYAPRITSFSFDRGGFEIWSQGGAIKELEPEYQLTVTAVGDDGPLKTDYRPDLRAAMVHGPIPNGDRFIEAFAMPDPAATAARFLGGTIVNTDERPPDRKPDYVIEGPELRDVLKECLEKSDNDFAENLFLMSAGKDQALGDDAYKDAEKRITQFLHDAVGLPKGSVEPVDGSGMSRHNMVTPKSMCRALRWAYRQDWRGDFLRALASPGEGTLTSRLRTSTFLGKTGTLNAVICLTGYLKDRSGHTLVASMLFNNTIAPPHDVRALQDRIITILERSSK